ncbi:ABC transporter ATP-binding protein (plasmid) [Haloferax prahovense]|uniref:ABC transporter ATP-binding protein n=1 Tax=Haloferax prahovense TaxID=381852 RepID=UPI003C71CA35
MTDPLVQVQDLKKYYFDQDSIVDRLLRREPDSVKAVDGVSFEVEQGETLGLVGESGCGKSTTGETLLGLREATAGRVFFDGTDIFKQDDLTEFRRNTGIVFQDPFSSLDPRMTVHEIVREPMIVHDVGTKAERRDRVLELLEQVGLSSGHIDRYPHEFSGGQRQRIGIARALALEPKFIVLDEPVSALDVSVQAQILNLLADLQEELDLTYLLIAHDLSVVKHISDTVAVMYLGQIVEQGPADDVFAEPEHPYTQALLESVPRARTEEAHRKMNPIEGDVPSPRNPPSGCSFRTRCPAVIPPEDIEIEQETYRELMTLRERLLKAQFDINGLIDDSTDAHPDTRTVVEAFFSQPPSETTRELVREAIDQHLSGDEDSAVETLREPFESVCEVDDPELLEDDHLVACHRHR